MVGQTLDQIPSVRMSWKKWRQIHPDTQVLSIQTGFTRNYAVDPYKGYYRVGGLMFPVGGVRRDLSPKEKVLGVSVKGHAKAYALEQLQKEEGIFKDRVGMADISIEVSPEGEIVAVRDSAGQPIAHMFVYWFAWQAFHPETEVHRF